MRILFSLALVCAVSVAFTQSKFVPTVLALYPNEIKEDSISALELQTYRQKDIVTEQMKKEFLREGLAPNWKTIREKELAFMNDQDFYTLFVLATTRGLTYHEIENRTNLLIYPGKQPTANTLPAYKKLADQNKMSWIVNIVRSEAIAGEGKRLLKMTVQLYNAVTNRLYLDKVYTADSSSLTLSDTCSDTWLCLSEAIQKEVIHDLTDKIEKNIRHERQ